MVPTNETTTIGTKADELESSIYRFEKIKNNLDGNKHLSTTLKFGAIDKKSINDNGSPFSTLSTTS